jgi:hypothetical protein
MLVLLLLLVVVVVVVVLLLRAPVTSVACSMLLMHLRCCRQKKLRRQRRRQWPLEMLAPESPPAMARLSSVLATRQTVHPHWPQPIRSRCRPMGPLCVPRAPALHAGVSEL